MVWAFVAGEQQSKESMGGNEMGICMQIARDIVVKLIEHGSFDNLPATTTGSNPLQTNEQMATQICNVFREVFETVSDLENNSETSLQKLYQSENQI